MQDHPLYGNLEEPVIPLEDLDAIYQMAKEWLFKVQDKGCEDKEDFSHLYMVHIPIKRKHLTGKKMNTAILPLVRVNFGLLLSNQKES